jgi:uncharacterized repeat protein (TIGR02543 family)
MYTSAHTLLMRTTIALKSREAQMRLFTYALISLMVIITFVGCSFLQQGAAPISYTLSYSSNGNSAGSVPPSNDFDSGEMVTVSGAGTLTKSGYSFNGWNSTVDGSGAQYAAAGTFNMMPADLTLYAVWTVNQYTLDYDGNDNTDGSPPISGNFDFGAALSASDAGTLTRTGYGFAGWNTAAVGSGDAYAAAAGFSMPAENITLYAQWTPGQYVVDYNGNGSTSGSTPGSDSYEYGDSVTVSGVGSLEKTGYEFSEWNTSNDGNGTAYASAATLTMPAANIILYAVWTVNQYTLSYDGNDNTGGSAPVSGSFDYGATVTAADAGTLTRTGYGFAGWNTAAGGNGDAYAASAIFNMPAVNMTLYAVWTISQYSVSYNGNDSTGGSTPASGSYDYGDTVTVSGVGTLERDSYGFIEWNTSADGTGDAYTSGATFSLPAMAVTLFAQWVYQYQISTLAGTGISGFTGDGGAALSATLNQPEDVTVDSLGNIYIADTYNHVVRKVDASGNISTVAGTGVQGYSGDGLAATSAQLSYPEGVAVDGTGNIYIADLLNDAIRMVDTSGVISTIAGTGVAGYSGDGGAATSAQIQYPYRITLDTSGNIYFSSTANHVVRKIDTSGMISTIAGTGTSGYSGDEGVATAVMLKFPNGIALDSDGNLYIADYTNKRIRKVDSSGMMTTIAGTGSSVDSGDGGPAISAGLNFPSGIAVDSDDSIYIAETNGRRIRKIDGSGIITTIAGDGTSGYSGDGGAATSANLNSPSSVVVDSSGNIFVADSGNHVIRKLE